MPLYQVKEVTDMWDLGNGSNMGYNRHAEYITKPINQQLNTSAWDISLGQTVLEITPAVLISRRHIAKQSWTANCGRWEKLLWWQSQVQKQKQLHCSQLPCWLWDPDHFSPNSCFSKFWNLGLFYKELCSRNSEHGTHLSLTYRDRAGERSWENKQSVYNQVWFWQCPINVLNIDSFHL